jgi:hypothetical protein
LDISKFALIIGAPSYTMPHAKKFQFGDTTYDVQANLQGTDDYL